MADAAAWADANAASLGVDLEPIEAAVGQLRSQVDTGRMPGFLACAVQGEPGNTGKLLHWAAHGLADVAARMPLCADTLFRLYSQTKPVTIVGFMRLMEKGMVSLEDPLVRYIPSFAKLTVGSRKRSLKREVRLHDLLAHTSGIGFGPGFGNEPENDYEKHYWDLVKQVDSGRVQTLKDWCDELAKVPLRFQPGMDWGYGYSSDVLGRVVEVVSGCPLDEFLTKEVLQPLGMRDTFFEVPTNKAQRLGALYNREPWDGSGPARKVEFIVVDPSGLPQSDGCRSAPSSSVFLAGSASKVIQGGGCVCSVAGGLVSTVQDYAKFGQMMVNEGEFNGIRLLEPASVRLLARDWLNDYTLEKRRKPLWVWGTVGVGFSPLGQIGLAHPEAVGRRGVGAALNTVHWGGAGGSGYMFNWPHRLLVLTYTGCTYDTATQKLMWRAAFNALRRGGAKALFPPKSESGTSKKRKAEEPPGISVKKRPCGKKLRPPHS